MATGGTEGYTLLMVFLLAVGGCASTVKPLICYCYTCLNHVYVSGKLTERKLEL